MTSTPISRPTLNPALRNFWTTQARNKVLYGGRSSSKSWDAAGFAIFLANKYSLRFCCARQIQNKIEESVYTLLKIQIDRFGLRHRFRILNNKIINRVNDLAKALAKLLNIDPKSWSLKWDFTNFIDQMGEFSKMLNMIADLLNAIKDGRWADAASIGKQLLNQGSDQPSAMPMVTDSANGAADWIKEHWGFDPRSVGRTVRGWFRGDEPEQYGQSVKRPQPTKMGAELLGWMQPMLTHLEHLYRLPEGLLRSVAITESGGNQFAVSGAGAKGLFQFMDGTARDMGMRGNDVFDPEKAARAAAKYLSQLLQANGGDLSKALASYNWGIGNVQKHGMALMPQEARNYIPKVLSNMPGNGVKVDQKNTYHIYGGGDPRSVGTEVERRQQSANA